MYPVTQGRVQASFPLMVVAADGKISLQVRTADCIKYVGDIPLSRSRQYNFVTEYLEVDRYDYLNILHSSR